MSTDDADVCVHCLHPAQQTATSKGHGPAGCEHVTASGICPCSEHPDPYDPSAP